MVAECKEENAMCEWSHIYDESEWSLMISLIRRWGFPLAHSVGRSFKEMRGSYAFLHGPCFAPINKIQVKPRFVMAALIIRSQAK